MDKKELILKMAQDLGYSQYSSIDEIDECLWHENNAERITEYLTNIIMEQSKWFTTFDGHQVKSGDNVYVIGSGGISQTMVDVPTTKYMYYNSMIRVENSFARKEAAEQYIKNYL